MKQFFTFDIRCRGAALVWLLWLWAAGWSLPAAAQSCTVSTTSSQPSICPGGSSVLTATASATNSGYTTSTISYVPVSVASPQQGPIGDDLVIAYPIGFSFSFFGTSYTQFSLSSNGNIQFGGSDITNFASAIPNTSTPNNYVALALTDWYPSSAGMITYATVGTAPNRRLVVSYNAVPAYNASGQLTGQIVLYETSNVIDLLIGTQSNTGYTKVQGVENATGTAGVASPGRNALDWTASSSAQRFTPSSGGGTSFTYAWSPATGLSSTTGASVTAQPSVTTTYTVTATSNTGCQSTSSQTVTVDPTPTAPVVRSAGTAATVYTWTSTPALGGTNDNGSYDNFSSATQTIPAVLNVSSLNISGSTGLYNGVPGPNGEVGALVHNHSGAGTTFTIALYNADNGQWVTVYTGSSAAGDVYLNGLTATFAPISRVTQIRFDSSPYLDQSFHQFTSVPISLNSAASSGCGARSETLLASGGALGASYRWYSAAVGGTLLATGSTYTTPTLGSTTTYYAAAVNATGCEGPRASITVNVVPGPTAPAVARCGAGAVTLTASGAPAGGTYRWYSAASGGTLLSTAASYTTPTLSSSTLYYVAVANSAGCESSRTATQAVINAVPGAPTVATGTSNNSYTWTTTPTSGTNNGSYSDFDVASQVIPDVYNVTGLTFSNTTAYVHDHTGQGQSSTTFAVELYNPDNGVWTTVYTGSSAGDVALNGMSFSFPAVAHATQIRFNSNPYLSQSFHQFSPLTIGFNGTSSGGACGSGAVTLTASGAPAGGTYRWYNAASGGTLLSSGSSYTTPVLTSSTSYYASAVSSAGCEGPRTAATAVVNPRPTVAASSAAPTICAGTATLLTATGAATYVWSPATGLSSTTGASVTAQPSVTTTYTVTGTAPTGCQNTATVTVTVLPAPTQPSVTPASLCGPGSATLTASGAPSGGSYRWYSVPSGGTVLSTAATYTTPTLSSTTTYYVASVSSAGCESARSTTQVSVSAVPAAPTAVSNGTTNPTTWAASWTTAAGGFDVMSQTIPTAYNVTGLSISGSTGTGYNGAAGPNGEVGAFAHTHGTTATITIDLFDADRATWVTVFSRYVTATDYYFNGLNITFPAIARATQIRFNSIPAIGQAFHQFDYVPITFVSGSGSACGSNSVLLTASGAPSGGSYRWYGVPSGGTVLGSASTYTTPVLSSSTTYYVASVSTSGCESPRTAVTATITPAPTVAAQASPASVMPGVASTLSVTNPLPGYTYSWSGPGLSATTGTSVTARPTTVGQATYTVTGSNGTCSAATSVTVTVTPLTFVWTGTVSSDWATAANWSGNQVPAAADDATITANRPFSAQVTSLQAVRQLTIEPGAQLTVAPAGVLDVRGDFLNHGSFASMGTGEVRMGQGIGQEIGGAAATTFGNLTVSGNGVVLLSPTAVARLLTLNANLSTNGYAFTLLSDATGTAMVVNNGGEVLGTATMQRYLNPLNPGLGYRHYSSPVRATTVADLATAGFQPLLNTAYNALPTPVLPLASFPNVYEFDESRMVPAFTGFDTGWKSPASAAAPLVPGRGYSVNLDAQQKVDLNGTLNNGAVTVTGLGHSGQSQSGWQLLGNPYPAPIDWDLVQVPAGMEQAMYVFQSTGTYTGRYTPYVNGVGLPGTEIIAPMQGFFVRTASASPVSLTFTNACRLTSYTNPSMGRGTADARPLLQLDVRDAQQRTDAAFVYFDQSATSAVDAAFDARKVPNTDGTPNLFTVTPAGEALAINGLGALAPTVLPLGLHARSTGPQTLHAAQLRVPAGTQVMLEDRKLGQWHDLSQSQPYAFTWQTADSLGRFFVHFRPSGVLAAATGQQAELVQVYPNPTRGEFTVTVPPSAGPVRVTLLNTLGQQVLERTVSGKQQAQRLRLDASHVALGIYLVRVSSAEGTTTRKLYVE